mmetsp:Transcript_16760/g.53588  ORF Transcript_16760/g.53588 Transcript_16760/m.53588 type:complete len:208 (+) Transcript_16760:1965-2588(+)
MHDEALVQVEKAARGPAQETGSQPQRHRALVQGWQLTAHVPRAPGRHRVGGGAGDRAVAGDLKTPRLRIPAHALPPLRQLVDIDKLAIALIVNDLVKQANVAVEQGAHQPLLRAHCIQLAHRLHAVLRAPVVLGPRQAQLVEDLGSKQPGPAPRNGTTAQHHASKSATSDLAQQRVLVDALAALLVPPALSNGRLLAFPALCDILDR